VPILWPLIFQTGHEIAFAHTSFKWANLASHNAGVIVAIIGISNHAGPVRRLYAPDDRGKTVLQETANINAYLAAAPNIIVTKSGKPRTGVADMSFGNMPRDGGHLLLEPSDVARLELSEAQRKQFVRPFVGSQEFIRGQQRYCLWIKDEDVDEALSIDSIGKRIDLVRQERLSSRDKGARDMAETPHKFREQFEGKDMTIVVPGVSSENRDFLPVGVAAPGVIVSNLAFALYDAPLWNMALIASRLHLVWIATVCGRLGTGYRYSNTLGWNTFPIPKLTGKNRDDLTRCAEDILLAREAHFPATLADLYDPETMPDNLRTAHERNDETLERIYIGRRFRNDTERLEKLFTLYTHMTGKEAA